MQIDRRPTKTIQQYRHNIKLLKYYLKKQRRLNQTLKYKKSSNAKKEKFKTSAPLQRIYSGTSIVQKLSLRLKQMGLTLGDIFRMTDTNYKGQINKEQFIKTISRLKADIQDNVVNQLFYAIDTNLNGILDQDQYEQFLVAFGGADSKQANKFQKKTMEKLVVLLKKKNTKPEDFIVDMVDPTSVYDFKKKLISLGLNQNEVMILLKAFDPSSQGNVSHQLFLSMMKTVDQKNQQQIVNQKFEKDIKQLCIQWRDQKINPIKIFQQADVDKQDGVTPSELQAAFKKLMPGQTAFQIKKWVSLINLNNDRQISRQQFSNSIRSLYSLNQLQKFSTAYQKQHPGQSKQLQKQGPSTQQIINKLEAKIVDNRMTNKQAFQYFDINKNGLLDKEELYEGLKKLGINVLFIGRVLAVFDRDATGEIDLNQFLKVMGQDVQIEQLDAPQINFSQDQDQGQQAFKTQKKKMQPLAEKKNQKDQSISKVVDKKAKLAITNKKSFLDQPNDEKAKKKTVVSKDQKKVSKDQKNINNSQKKIQQSKLKPKVQKISPQKQKKTLNQSIKKQVKTKQQKKPQKQQIKGKQLKKSIIKQSKIQQKIVNKQQKAIIAQNKAKIIKQQKKPQIKKKPQVQKKPQPQYQPQIQQKTQEQTNYQEIIAILYKKHPKQILSKFKKQDRKSKGILNLTQWLKAINQLKLEGKWKDQDKNDVYQQNVDTMTGKGIKYQEWLEDIAGRYAEDVQTEEKQSIKQVKKQINSELPKKKQQQSKPLKNQQLQQAQQYNYQQQDQEVNFQQQIAIQYKKRPKQILAKFKKIDRKNKGILNFTQWLKAINQIKVQGEWNQQDKNNIYQQNVDNMGKGIKYQEWLEDIAGRYAQNIQTQEKQELPIKSVIKKQQNQKFFPIKRIQSKIIDNQQKNKKDTIDKRGISQTKQQISKPFVQLLTHKLEEKEVSKEGYKLKDFIKNAEQILKLQKQYLPKAQALRKSGKKFLDKSFPTTLNSISGIPQSSRIAGCKLLSWKHYSQIFSNPQLFQGSIQPNDIKQGGLGNCYFLSALACLAEYTNLIERLFQYYDLKSGYFLVWLCIDGRWTIYQLDGYIVVDASGKNTAFSRTDKQELWVILLEKAYAKAYGTFQKIYGGQPYEAIQDLSGSPSVSIRHQGSKQSQVWEKLLQANDKKQIMAAATQRKPTGTNIKGRQEGVTQEGIVLGHAYSILDVRQINGQKIIQLRNPWGSMEWKGDWSDNSKKWTPQMLKMLSYTLNAQDGIFWMPFSQYFKQYSMCSVNSLHPTYFSQCISQPAIKRCSLKFPISFQGYIILSQKDHRHQQGCPTGQPYVLANIVTLICKDGKVLRQIENRNVSYYRDITVGIKDLGKGEYPVVIVSMEKQTNLNIGYYAPKQTNFQICHTDVEKYFQALAFTEEDRAQQMGDLNFWMSVYGDQAYLCFKNKSQTRTQYIIELPSPQNIKILPPQGLKNKINIKYGEIKTIKGKRIDNRKGCSFGGMSYA